MKNLINSPLIMTFFISTQIIAGNPNQDAAQIATNTAQIATNTAAITALQTAPSVGDNLTTTQGGIVACTSTNGGFNLIASATDDTASVDWSNIGSTEIGTSAQSRTAGASDTTAIIAQSGFTSGAANVCRNKTTGGYTDWYLPAKNELNCLFEHQTAIGGFSSQAYWSSTEIDANDGSAQNFQTGSQAAFTKSSTKRVRCVRNLIL